MMNKLQILGIILVLITGYNAQSCTNVGLSCRDCWTSKICRNNGNGELVEEIIACPSGTSCQKSSGACNDAGNYECDDSSMHVFNCRGPGVFPDPYNCRNYHTCVFSGGILKEIESKCNDSYAFDPYTGRCGIRLEDSNKCSSSVPICTNAGKSGPIGNYPGIFYICVEGFIGFYNHYLPELFACPANHYFNGSTCQDPTPIFLDYNGKCMEKGDFYDSNSCNFMKVCESVGSDPVIVSCGPNKKFDQINRECVPLTCADYHL